MYVSRHLEAGVMKIRRAQRGTEAVPACGRYDPKIHAYGHQTAGLRDVRQQMVFCPHLRRARDPRFNRDTGEVAWEVPRVRRPPIPSPGNARPKTQAFSAAPA